MTIQSVEFRRRRQPLRPLIGFVAGYDEDRPFFEKPAELIRGAGANLVMLAHTNDDGMIEEYMNLVDAVVIGGGVEDISPARYRAAAHEKLGPQDAVRDHFDLAIVRHCLERDIPLLGICRGSQAINVALGGTLCQDLASRDAESGATHHGDWTTLEAFHATPHMHAVQFESGSSLRAALRSRGEEVCSYHHQAVDALGADIAVTARAPDGVIEAIESRAHSYVVGVQWHPELAPAAPVNQFLIAEMMRHVLARKAIPKRSRAKRA